MLRAGATGTVAPRGAMVPAFRKSLRRFLVAAWGDEARPGKRLGSECAAGAPSVDRKLSALTRDGATLSPMERACHRQTTDVDGSRRFGRHCSRGLSPKNDEQRTRLSKRGMDQKQGTPGSWPRLRLVRVRKKMTVDMQHAADASLMESHAGSGLCCPRTRG